MGSGKPNTYTSADDQTDRLYHGYCLRIIVSFGWQNFEAKMARRWQIKIEFVIVFVRVFGLYCVIFQSRPLESQQTSENQFTPNQSSHLYMLKLQLATAEKSHFWWTSSRWKKRCSENRLTCKNGLIRLSVSVRHMFHNNNCFPLFGAWIPNGTD